MAAAGVAAQRARDVFLAAGYTVDGVAGRLGPVALAALQRAETVPAVRATRGGDLLDALVRLFLLQRTVAERQLGDAVAHLVALGAVERSGDDVRAVLDLRPYAEAGRPGEADDDGRWWVASDLGTGLDGRHRPLPAEHVLGVGGASTTLAQWTVRDPVARTLDLGTGCGVQALHAARHSREVVATDVSGRALRLAAVTAALSGVTPDLRRGDLLAPVAGESFDLVVCNPPFVVGAPDGAGRRTYRDAGRPLDGVCAELLADAPALLAPGGTLQLLASWVHRPDEPWQERVAGWLPDGVDALLVQREVLDPAEYVATWLRDAGEQGGPAYADRYDAWLAGLERAGVEAVGLGLVAVRRTDRSRRLTALDWPHPVEQPLGPTVARWFDRQGLLAGGDHRLLGTTFRLADDVVQEQVGPPGAEHPEHVVLRQQGGLRRVLAVDTATAAVAGACEGNLPLGVLVEAVREVLGPDDEVDADALTGRVAGLVEAGVLHPVPQAPRGPAV